MIYRDLHASLMRFCQEFADTFEEGSRPVFVNLDNSWDEGELPKDDITGYLSLSYEINDQLVEGTFQVGYSSRDDTNLFRLVAAIDKLADRLRPMNKIQLYDADTGDAVGLMICKNGTRVMPVSGSKSRPVQFVAVAFATTLTYSIPADIVSGEVQYDNG